MGTKIRGGFPPTSENSDTGLVARTELNKLISQDRIPFNPGNLSLTDKETYCDVYRQFQEMNVVDPTTDYGVGAAFMVLIQANGSNINFPSDWIEVENSYTGVAGNYMLTAVYNGVYWAYALKNTGGTLGDIPPAIQQGIFPTSNAYVDVYLNTGVYGADDGLTPINLADLNITFSQNGGTATNWVATSIEKAGGGALTGGEEIVRVNGTITGTADSNEYIDVQVAGADTIFNSNGDVMDSNSKARVNLSLPYAETWVNYDVSIYTPNDDSITKIGGGDAWSTGAALEKAFSGNFTFEWYYTLDVTGSAKNFMAGATDDNDVNALTDLNYCIYHNNGTLLIWEGGTQKHSIGAGIVTDGDTVGFRVIRTGSTITYYYNINGGTWTLGYTSAVASSGNLYFGLVINTEGIEIFDILI